jgi:hypothetical protein
VVHSLGGLLLQRTLNISRESRFPHLRPIETCTIGICFLGTPHHGADLAKWGDFLSSFINLAKPVNRNVVKLLKPGSEVLVDCQDAFHNILEKRKEERSKIEVVCFFETLPLIRTLVVPKESAIISGELNYPIRSNHMVIKVVLCKLSGRMLTRQGHDKILQSRGQGIPGYSARAP